MSKTVVPKSKYSNYKGKDLLIKLVKDLSKVFVPMAGIVFIIIYFFEVDLKINDTILSDSLKGAIVFFFVIMGFWLFLSVFAFVIISVSNKKTI
ncbi:MAG: hypothetical protein ABJR05_09695 [Balneola sp.]